MRDALQHHPVKGTTASVNVVDESKQDLLMKKLPQFSRFHNFNFEDLDVKAWKAYNVGEGKLFPYNSMYVTQRGPTQLQTKEKFFESAMKELDLKTKQSVTTKTEKGNASQCLFECNVKCWRSTLMLASIIKYPKAAFTTKSEEIGLLSFSLWMYYKIRLEKQRLHLLSTTIKVTK